MDWSLSLALCVASSASGRRVSIVPTSQRKKQLSFTLRLSFFTMPSQALRGGPACLSSLLPFLFLHSLQSASLCPSPAGPVRKALLPERLVASALRTLPTSLSRPTLFTCVCTLPSLPESTDCSVTDYPSATPLLKRSRLRTAPHPALPRTQRRLK